ncbi:hypothetical protein [Serratia microhaemolytica]|uniref:hypothetical protein n=1 Tax=Serratia microhaemolytica TaxID=2675110 RepID=UPI000FDDA422|nr:hypothetical protein [Serratia microhaemolytica]
MPSIKQINNYLLKHELARKYKDRSIFEDDYGFELSIEDCDNSPDGELIINSAMLFTHTYGQYGRYYLTLACLENQLDNKYLCGYLSNSIIVVLCDYYGTTSIAEEFVRMFSFQAEKFLTLMACNQFSCAEASYDQIIDAIKSGKMSRSTPWGRKTEQSEPGPLVEQRLGVLLVEMLASERKETVDWASANIPADPFYLRFCHEALYSTDETLLKEWLVALCDKHLEHTSLFLENAEKSPLTGYEIKEPMLLAWPFEYYAVKNFRARHGLSTPVIEHPLFTTPIGGEHLPDFSRWEAPEWFHPLLERLIKVDNRFTTIYGLIGQPQ